MVTLARHNYENESISWQIDIQPEDLILYADENLISQVMINLLKNAQQAISYKLVANDYEQANSNKSSNISEHTIGLITIKASCNESESIIIEVSNNGAAIPDEEVAHIFIPFFTTKENGSGVGLSVARQIMRLSGGSITLKKDHASGITTFILTFP